MAEEKSVTEREAVLRERKAYRIGRQDERRIHLGQVFQALGGTWPNPVAMGKAEQEWNSEVHKTAERAYPLPVKKRYVHLKFSDGSVRSRMDERSCACWSGPRRYATLDLVDIGKMLGDTAEDYEMIARIIRGELEDVPEGEK